MSDFITETEGSVIHHVSMRAARKAGLERYYTGIPCIFGHLCERLTWTQKCIECERIGYTQDDVRKQYGNNGYHRRGNVRKERLNKATPKWIDPESVRLSIDHIVPLRGYYYLFDGTKVEVCGLNVPWNLQMITIKENRFKKHRMNEKDLAIACSLQKGIPV